MTSSATQTEPATPDNTEAGEGADASLMQYLGTGVVTLLLLVGGIVIFQANRWHITPPTVFLFLGWVGVVLTARYLWNAGWSAADVSLDDEDYWLPVGKKDELLAEKRSLLKAIKELEFDREMGKLSERDADDLTKHYRGKAIDVIKAIEALGDDEPGAGGADIATQIEREVKARMAVSAHSKKVKKRGIPKGRKRKGGAKPEKNKAKAGATKAPSAAEASAADGDEDPEAEAALVDEDAKAEAAEGGETAEGDEGVVGDSDAADDSDAEEDDKQPRPDAAIAAEARDA